MKNLESLVALGNLKQLAFTPNKKVGSLIPLTGLSRLSELSLNLSYSMVSKSESLTKLRNLTQLTLDLDSSDVNDFELLANLGNQTQLTIYFKRLQFGYEEELAKLVKLTQLTQLTLNFVLSQERVELNPLGKLKGLTEFRLILNDKVGALSWLTELPNLKKLSIEGANKEQRQSLQNLPPKLKELSF